MSTGNRGGDGHDERQLRPREGRTGFAQWLHDVYYHGVGQTVLMGIMVLWAVLSTPYVGLEAKTAAVGAWPAAALTVGTLRSGVVDLGRPWPRLVPRRLGTGTEYRNWVGRAAYVSATLGLATYGATALAVAVGSVPLALPVAAVLAVAGFAAYPFAVGSSHTRRALRAGYYAVGLGLVAAFSAPLSPTVGDPAIVLYLVVLAGCAVVDLTTDDEVSRPSPGGT